MAVLGCSSAYLSFLDLLPLAGAEQHEFYRIAGTVNTQLGFASCLIPDVQSCATTFATYVAEEGLRPCREEIPADTPSFSFPERPEEVRLDLGLWGTGSGTVGASPSCCTYDYGTVVTLTATPDTGSEFIGWSGACSGTGSCVVTMDLDKGVVAQFDLVETTLSISQAGTGSGTVGASPSCCTYDYGTVVTLTATPDTGSEFTGWSGACSGAGSCVLTMEGDKSVTATFEEELPSTPGISGSWSGSWWVTSPSDSDCAESGSWTASITSTNGIISGSFSGGPYAGSISGTWDGTTAIWTVSGSGGVVFSGTVIGTGVSGSWSNGMDCYDFDVWPIANLGPTSGGFSGSQN